MSAKARILDVLRAKADPAGVVAGTFADIQEWVGPEAGPWDIHLLLIQLNEDGEFVNFMCTPLGDFHVTVRT
jgi:hypothetical protein